MNFHQNRKAYTFNDVLLVPNFSNIQSRFSNEINLSTSITPTLQLKYPIISANMDSVTESKMCSEMYHLGGLGICHRFFRQTYTHIDELNRIRNHKPVLCIGANKRDFEQYKAFIKDTNVLIDVAHGHSQLVVDQIKRIKDQCSNTYIIAGNICTGEGFVCLADAGADSIKVGVGPGHACSTRIQTGNGYPQLSAISDCFTAKNIMKEYGKVSIIADGGIKNSGDIVKALAAGADAVMIGSLFAGTEESPGEKIGHSDGSFYKIYRGSASKEAQIDWKGNPTSIEGVQFKVPYKGSVKNVFNDLMSGVRSGMSYQGAKSLEELRKNAKFIEVSHSGFTEGTPYGKT